jgi:hypothetical protein
MVNFLWTLVYLSLALGINFCTPEIPEYKKLITVDNCENEIALGFPYQYFKGEVLTDEMVDFRFRAIRMTIGMYITLTLSIGSTVGPIVGQVIFTPTAHSVEKVISTSNHLIHYNQLVSCNQSNPQQFVTLRGGELTNAEVIRHAAKILMVLAMYQLFGNIRPSDSFQQNLINQDFKNLGQGQQLQRKVPRIVKDDLYYYRKYGPDFKKFGPGGPRRCLKHDAKRNPSLDTMANLLSPEYLKYQNNEVPPFLRKRFNTNKCSYERFVELARDPRYSTPTFTRVSIEEALIALQAEMEGLIINPRRPDSTIARKMDLDFLIDGPNGFTHLDTKQPVGTETLKIQGQSETIEGMGNKIGKRLVQQKKTFVGVEGGPKSPENVLHLITLNYLPDYEKQPVIDNVLNGAEEAGSTYGIKFMNELPASLANRYDDDFLFE